VIAERGLHLPDTREPREEGESDIQVA